MLTVTPTLHIHERDIEEKFVRSSGPGGQHVNKVATAVELRFDVHGSRMLSATVRERLRHIAAPFLTSAGVIVIEARRFRSQQQNRQDARRRLAVLIRKALVVPRVRHATKPTARARERRRDVKQHRSRQKTLRRHVTVDE